MSTYFLKHLFQKRDISSTEEASFKTNTVFEDPGYLVKCKHEHRYLNKKSSGYIYVSIKPVKTYSCLLEETGEWSSAEFVGYTIPIFEKGYIDFTPLTQSLLSSGRGTLFVLEQWYSNYG